jgi:Icc-related predicted phosphoesterase
MEPDAGGKAGFVRGYLLKRLKDLSDEMGRQYPHIFVILGNDDSRAEEDSVLEGEAQGRWKYVHFQKAPFGQFSVYGYSFVPPTPFLLKDWERYDVSRYTDPGCISPEEGIHSCPVPASELKYSTIALDLDKLVDEDAMERTVMLFHSPPYGTNLDYSASGGKMVESVPIDLHIGSIAIRRFIEQRQPLLTLHGHIHEAARLSSSWRDRIGRTHAFSAAHDGPELALIRFDLDDLSLATRELI